MGESMQISDLWIFMENLRFLVLPKADTTFFLPWYSLLVLQKEQWEPAMEVPEQTSSFWAFLIGPNWNTSSLWLPSSSIL